MMFLLVLPCTEIYVKLVPFDIQSVAWVKLYIW